MSEMCIKQFAIDESGAITVDWVVLTAAIAGIAIAVLTIIAGGIYSSATTTTDSLDDAENVASLIGSGAPPGYVDSGHTDVTTGAAVYISEDGNNVSVGGTVSGTQDYYDNNAYSDENGDQYGGNQAN